MSVISQRATLRPSRLLSLQRRYTFAFAAVLSVAMLIVNLETSQGGFGWTQQLANLAPLAIAAMASTPSIISGGGGIDLSVSPTMTLTSVIFVAWLVPAGLGGAISVPIILGIGLVIGLLNGFLIISLRIPPVVLTLASYFVLIGVSAKILASPQYLTTTWVSSLGGDVGPIPGALFTIGAPLAIWFLIGLVPYRTALYIVGSNDATAFSSGLNVALVRMIAYGIGGLFSAIGGFALTAITLSADPSQATTYTLVAVASVALGGTSLLGGRGGIVGPLLGAATIYLLQDLLVTLQLNTTWLQVVYGATLVIAVVLSGVVSRTRTKL
ncbi:MAG TPA: ABC transporter permease [Solirubrobacteraceae bacterium]|nr:ABC transporter permease [Solirubrobacteraceae bacterium]